MSSWNMERSCIFIALHAQVSSLIHLFFKTMITFLDEQLSSRASTPTPVHKSSSEVILTPRKSPRKHPESNPMAYAPEAAR